ncbi:uncharacterized protein DS421_11g335990 [Arachis hypogaea]|nr:uncharacterized protein DS421_11g335990 [Arachis hypogaea]
MVARRQSTTAVRHPIRDPRRWYISLAVAERRRQQALAAAVELQRRRSTPFFTPPLRFLFLELSLSLTGIRRRRRQIPSQLAAVVLPSLSSLLLPVLPLSFLISSCVLSEEEGVYCVSEGVKVIQGKQNFTQVFIWYFNIRRHF